MVGSPQPLPRLPYKISLSLTEWDMVQCRGFQGDVVYLGWPIEPSRVGGGGGCGPGLSQWILLCSVHTAHHVTWSPYKLWRSNSIFNLWLNDFLSSLIFCYPHYQMAGRRDPEAKLLDRLRGEKTIPVPEFIDPVFTKTSPKRSFSLNRKRAFWLVFAKTGSIISGTGIEQESSVESITNIYRSPYL